MARPSIKPDQPYRWQSFMRAVPERCEVSIPALARLLMIELAHKTGRNGAPVKPSTLRTIASVLNKIVVPAFCDLTARELTTDILIAHQKALVAQGRAAKYQGKIQWTISRLMNHAVYIGAADRNPVVDIPLEFRPTKKVRDPNRARMGVLSLGEIARLIRSDKIPFERRLLWAVILLTGARIGEAIALYFADWAPEFLPLGQIAIRRSWDGKSRTFNATKTDDNRYLPVHPALAPFLFEARENFVRAHGRMPGDGDLICQRKLPRSDSIAIWSAQTVLACFRRDVTLIGVADPVSGPRRTHDTRHTFITQLRKAGADDLSIQAMTHSTTDRTGTAYGSYVHLDHEDLCQAMLKLQI